MKPLMNFDASLVESFEKIEEESMERYGNNWRDGMSRPGCGGFETIWYCQWKRANHIRAILKGEEMDHSGVPHYHKVMWWFRAEAHFVDKMSLEALKGFKAISGDQS